MKFMMIVKANPDFEAGNPPNPKLMEAVAKLAASDFTKRTMIMSGGLAPSSKGSRIQASGGKLTITDGPFAETKELVGGFAIFELESMEEAIEAGKGFMQLHVDVMGPSYEGQLEIRPIFGGDPAAAR
jgi:hypothetical protein